MRVRSLDEFDYNRIMEEVAVLKQQKDKMDASMISILSLVGKNKFAMLELCQSPELVKMCRQRYGLDSSMSDEAVRDYLRGRLCVDEDKPAPGPSMHFDLKALAQQKMNRFKVVTEERINNAWIPDDHTLEIKNRNITGRGYAKGDKDFREYCWVKPSEYVRLWKSVFAHENVHKSVLWLGIFDIRVRYEDKKPFDDFTCGKFGGSSGRATEGNVQRLAGERDLLTVNSYSPIFAFRRLMYILYDKFGDAYAEKLGALMIQSWLGAKGVPAEYSEFLVSKAILKECGITVPGTKGYMELPGLFDREGSLDAVVINNANLVCLKDDSSSTEIYRKFNNECVYTELFLRIWDSLSSCDVEDGSEADDYVRFLISPELQGRV